MCAVASATGASDCCHGLKHPCNPSGSERPPPPARTTQSPPAAPPAACHRCCEQIEGTRGGENKHGPPSSHLMENIHLLYIFIFFVTNCLATARAVTIVTQTRAEHLYGQRGRGGGLCAQIKWDVDGDKRPTGKQPIGLEASRGSKLAPPIPIFRSRLNRGTLSDRAGIS